jgi:hypothetical protein
MPVKCEVLWGSHITFQPSSLWKTVFADGDIESYEDFHLTTLLWMLVIPVLVKCDSSVNEIFAVNIGSISLLLQNPFTGCTSHRCIVLLTSESTKYNRDTTVVLVMYGVLKVYATGCYIDGRLSFSNLKDLHFHSYIAYRMWVCNILQHSMKCSHLLELALNRKDSTMICDSLIGYFSFIFSNSVCSNYFGLS